ncbi:MAG: hypothetical protein ACI4BG_05935 [Prevotella sp.]
MKQLKFLIMMLVTLLVCSCSSDEQYSSGESKINEEQVWNELLTKEDSLCVEFSNATRKTFPGLSLWQWCKVGFADAKGYIVGSGKPSERIVSAVVASISKYIEIVLDKLDKANKKDNAVKQAAPLSGVFSIDDSEISLNFVREADLSIFRNNFRSGEQHNSTIIALFEKYPLASDWIDVDTRTIFNRVVSEMQIKGFVKQNEVINYGYVLNAVGNTNYEYSELRRTLVPVHVSQSFVEDRCDRILCNFLIALSNINDNTQKLAFASEYINNLRASGLSPSSNDELMKGLGIAMASSVLWNVDYFKESDE